MKNQQAWSNNIKTPISSHPKVVPIVKCSRKLGYENPGEKQKFTKTEHIQNLPIKNGEPINHECRFAETQKVYLKDNSKAMKGHDRSAKLLNTTKTSSPKYEEKVIITKKFEPAKENEGFEGDLAATNSFLQPNSLPNFVVNLSHNPQSKPQPPTIVEENKEKECDFFTPRQPQTLMANLPVFKRNSLPQGEDSDDVISLDIEVIDETPKGSSKQIEKKKRAEVSLGTTTDNASEHSSNVFLDSSVKTEKNGPQNFLAHKLLGKGSFGEVYLVEKINTHILYAMKVLSKEK